MSPRQETDDDQRVWWLEGHLISRSKDVWHPMYGPMFHDVCRRLLSKFISLDDDALEKIDASILEYDDFRIRKYDKTIPRAQRGAKKSSTLVPVHSNGTKPVTQKVIKSTKKIKVRIKR